MGAGNDAAGGLGNELPSLRQPKDNLLDNYLALLLVAFVRAGLVQALVALGNRHTIDMQNGRC
jgi:hypothetical protein